MTIKAMKQELNNVGLFIVEGETKKFPMKKADVTRFYVARFPKVEEKPVEVEPVQAVEEKPVAAVLDFDCRVDAVLNALPAELLPETYPNLGDWIKIQVITALGKRKTVLEARLGKKELRIQAAEEVANAVGGDFRIVKSFSKPATYFLPYTDAGLDLMVRLGMEAREQMGL